MSVSIGSKPDKMIVKIINPSIFLSKESNHFIETDFEYEIIIPKQFTDETTYEITTNTEAAFDVVYQMGSTATLIFGLLVNFSLKQLWIFKNVMQVVVLLRILKQLPANLSSMLEALNDAVYFKLHYIIGE